MRKVKALKIVTPKKCKVCGSLYYWQSEELCETCWSWFWNILDACMKYPVIKRRYI